MGIVVCHRLSTWGFMCFRKQFFDLEDSNNWDFFSRPNNWDLVRDDSPNDQLLMNELDDEKVKNPEGGQAAVNDASDRMEEEELIRQEVDQGSIKNDTNIEPG